MPTPVQQSIMEQIAAGRLEQARAALVKYLQKSPKDADANAAMNVVLGKLGLPAQAEYYGERAVALAPGNPNFASDLGNTLANLGKPERALEMFERACAIDPRHASAHVGASHALLRMQLPEAARERAEAGIRAVPEEPRLIGNLSTALVQLGRAREAYALLQEGVRRFPGQELLVSALAAIGCYVDGLDPAELLRNAERYGMLLERAFPTPLPPVRAEGAERTLRVGLLSGDFRAHAVGFFVEPWLGLGGEGGGGFETYCYSTSLVVDFVTKRLRSKATAWREAGALGFEQLAELIRRDRVDILVELSGLTEGHRLPTMRLRPAPVQITAVGYPGTTGVRQIDYRVADSLTDPPGPPCESDRWCVEKLLRLDPCFLCYTPPGGGAGGAGAPAVRTEPAGEAIVFGSFNGLPKLDERALALWGAVLREAPGSRFIYKNLSLRDPLVRERVLERFIAAGVDAARVELLPPTESAASHLEAYHRLDIALDTYPYHGTTTTCDALFMGVPVVTLAGRMHVSRVGVSLLTNAGLPELIAHTDEEFVSIAAGLARDRERLAGLRSGLRERFVASPVCDAGAYSRRLAQSLRGVWREACAAAGGAGPARAAEGA